MNKAKVNKHTKSTPFHTVELVQNYLFESFLFSAQYQSQPVGVFLARYSQSARGNRKTYVIFKKKTFLQFIKMFLIFLCALLHVVAHFCTLVLGHICVLMFHVKSYACVIISALCKTRFNLKGRRYAISTFPTFSNGFLKYSQKGVVLKRKVPHYFPL